MKRTVKRRGRAILKRVCGTVAGHVVIACDDGSLLIIHPDTLIARPKKTLLRAADGDRAAIRSEFLLCDPTDCGGGEVVPVNWEAAVNAILAVARYLGEINPIAMQAVGNPSSRCPCGRFLRFAKCFDD